MNKGFTLIETLVYIGIFALICSSLLLFALSASGEDQKVIDGIVKIYEATST